MVKIRPATGDDAMRYYGKQPPFSFRGFVGEEDGEILGIGGVYRYGGMMWAFCEISEAGRSKRKSIMKVAHKVMELIDGKTVYAQAANLPTAPSFLERLGFYLVDAEHRIYRRLA
jgi:hypothetical protein